MVAWAAEWAALTPRFLPSSSVKEGALEGAASAAAVSRAAAVVVSTLPTAAVAAHEDSLAVSAARPAASTLADKRPRTTTTSARQSLLIMTDQNQRQTQDDAAVATTVTTAGTLARTRPRGGALKRRPMRPHAKRNWSSCVDLEWSCLRASSSSPHRFSNRWRWSLVRRMYYGISCGDMGV